MVTAEREPQRPLGCPAGSDPSLSRHGPVQASAAMIPILEGRSARLRFEPLAPRHAADLSEAILDPEVHRFISGPWPQSVEELAADFERLCRGTVGDNPQVWWNVAVFNAETGEGIGQVQATLVDGRAEVAYLFGSRHWGHGYAQEAMRGSKTGCAKTRRRRSSGPPCIPPTSDRFACSCARLSACRRWLAAAFQL